MLPGLFGVLRAAPPVLQPNQVLWVSNPATNGTIVGALGLTNTNNVGTPLTFKILSCLPYDPFAIETNPEFYGRLTVVNNRILAESNLFSLQVLVSNTSGTNTGSVLVLAPYTFRIPELSGNGVSAGRIITGPPANSLRFGVDRNATADSRALQAFSVLPNGEIQVADSNALDFEIQTNYVLRLVATNLLNSTPPYNEIPGEVVVVLANINEAPIFADQAFILPTNILETFIGTLRAEDPEHDALQFQIAKVEAGGGTIANDYFEISNGAELHLKSGAPPTPASSLLTVVVTEVRGDQQAPLTNVATVTVEAPKTYSRFGIPLLVPAAGHDGTPSLGLPIQAVASGTNQEVYVAGLDNHRKPYLQIYSGGLYRDPTLVALEASFVPTAIAAEGTNLYIGGSQAGLNTAVVYRYSTKGLPLRTNAVANATATCFSVMDLLATNGSIYFCGGAGTDPAAMKPYWATLANDTDLTIQLMSYRPGDIPGNKGVPWGVATAIANDGSGMVYVGGYWRYKWAWLSYNPPWWAFWQSQVYTTNSGRFTFLTSVSGPPSSVTKLYQSKDDKELGGAVITALKVGKTGGNAAVFAVEESAANGIRTVQLKKYDLGLALLPDESLTISGPGDVRAQTLTVAGEEGSESLYLSGVIPGAKQTKFTSGGGTPVTMYPSGDRFFLAKLEWDLKLSPGWSTPLLLSQYNYYPTGGLPVLELGASPTNTLPPLGPRAPLSIVVSYNAKDGVLLAGNIGGGTLTISQGGNHNSLTAPAGRNAGFVTIVKTNKMFEVPKFLEVVSEFGTSEQHVRPFNGKQMAVVDDTYTVEVVSPIYVRADSRYINSFTNPPSEQEIKEQAVTRYVCTGYTVADTATIGSSSSYTFKFKDNTKITFHWTVEHALEIRSDLTGTGAIPVGDGYRRDTVNHLGLTSLAAGNPSPEVKKHWVRKDELVIPTIDGTALDLAEFNTRYVVTGYVASGWVSLSTNQSGSGNQMIPFPAIEPRQQIPQFPMRGPAAITYLWGIQHRVQVSTTTLGSQDWPGIKVVDDPAQPNRTGVGEFWLYRGSHLIVGARDVQNSLLGALLATGDLSGRNLEKTFLDDFPTNFFELVAGSVTSHYLGAHVDRLLRGAVVSWEYGDQRYPQTVEIGRAVDVPLAAGLTNLVKINTNKPPVIQVLESPPGSTGPDMCERDEVTFQTYPLRPGRFLLHYEGRNDTNVALTLDITSQLPVTAHYRHLVHPEMPPVGLDPDPSDNLAFLKLAFTTNAFVTGSDFTATNRDLSVLLFSRSDSNAVPYQPATGNRIKERLYVRVVATTPWNEQPGGLDPEHPPRPTLSYIGTPLTSTRDAAGLGTGFIVYTNARYNAQIYDRARTAGAGPIIPVNRQFRTNDLTHNLVVIWYERQDGILWPYITERFDAQWPLALDPAALPDPLPDVETMAVGGTHYARRIVVASRLGSEGKDHALRNQLSLALPRYGQVTIYNQPDRNRPGYNPNEEHALIAPSFKFLDQANAPPVAYALRNHHNQADQSDTNYSSDPYVLVQYLDHGTNGGPDEYKMAVYAVELEDDRPQLNPDLYASPISGQEREFPYVFHYSMKAGEPVQPPYPLGLVIGLTPCNQTRGTNLSDQRVYWEDYRGQPWAVSAGDFRSHFYYALPEEFWVPDPNLTPLGTCIPFRTAGRVVLTGRIPNPAFKPNSQFILNGMFIRSFGITPDDFLLAINTTPLLSNQVQAVVLNTGEIQLRALGTNQLTLEDRANTPLTSAGLEIGVRPPTLAVGYSATWPEAVPILKAGETLTFSGGEYKADYPGADGLPGVIGWAAGEIIFDSRNPLMDNQAAFTDYTARLISPLEERYVSLNAGDAAALVQVIQPSTGVTRAKGTRWQFTDLPASLGRRIFYDPLNRRLALKGFVNDKTLGDSTLTATPPPVYVLEPDILTPAERNTLSSLVDLALWRTAVSSLYALSRNPNQLRSTGGSDADCAAFYAGLEPAVQQENDQDRLDTNGHPVVILNAARPQQGLGPGMALVPSPAVLDPSSGFTSGYVTLVENNNPDVGGAITLHIVKVSKEFRYRGAIKTILSDNVFDEKVTLRHSGDFGANADDLVYQWFYREEDGTEAALPPGDSWRMFPDQSDNSLRGLGMYQINLEGTGGLLLSDNLFFVRYRHRSDAPAAGPNSTDWVGTEWDLYGRFENSGSQATKVGAQWAGAANSPTPDGQYRPQLVMGWIKRVLDRVNPYEARISDFRNQGSPATYASMVQELGQRYEGPVALNADRNVIENVGLIELYETVLERGMDLSINLSSPITTPGINTALQLAATRISDFYVLLGNEAYSDAQAPTIAYGDDSMDFATDYGNTASSMFCFQNQVGSLMEEELGLLRGVPESYGRPVYNRLFWNFTKSLGEVAYTVNYDITDYNRDGFIDESDAMALFPQGHGDAWGHYLTALKKHYGLLRHPYYNWVSRAEQYNLLDVVIDVDYLDERRFAEAAAARAKAGAEIVNLTYRSRYVEDPDGQWQGYTDLDPDRAWGVDGWARRAGQGALFDWITANAIIPAQDTSLQHNALQKIDRTTVTAIQTLASELGEIQSQYDNANHGLNPLGLSPDVVPFDIDATFNAVGSTAAIGRPAVQGLGHFSQIYERAVAAVNNARTAFDNAGFMLSRQRQVVESADNFRQQVIEQDLDYRNRLIEIFGTPYEGQIGTGKAYPAGYNGPDLMLWMYVDVNDLNSKTVPARGANVNAAFQGFDIVYRARGEGTADFQSMISTYYPNDLTRLTNVNALDLATNNFVVISNLPIAASGYTFLPPADGSWGGRASPGEFQLKICEMVQAEADVTLAVGEYRNKLLKIQDLIDLLAAKHTQAAEIVGIREDQAVQFGILNGLKILAQIVSAGCEIAAETSEGIGDTGIISLPLSTPIAGMAVSLGDIYSVLRGALQAGESSAKTSFKVAKIASDKIAESLGDVKDILEQINEMEISNREFAYQLREQLKQLEQELREESILRLEIFKRLEALRQVSDRYRQTLQSGQRLLDQRQVFNIRSAGIAQELRYQDMTFKVFRNDALQKYRAAYDLAAKYTYTAAKAFDYETNLSPDDRASAIPLLTEIARSRLVGSVQDGEPQMGSGLAGALASLRDNWSVLCGRMSFNNPQYEQELISLRSELFRIPSGGNYDALWRQTLKQYRVDDLWQVPEFRRYCRPPAPRRAGLLPGLVIPFATEIVLGRNFFGWPLGPGDHAYDPSVFATKIQSAAVYFTNYQTAYLAATPRVYLVPAGLDVMTIPTSAELETREWTIVDQAIPVPYQTGTNVLADPYWIPAYDSLSEPFGQIRRFSSFLAKDITGFDASADALSYDTRLIGRSVWNTRWLLIIPGGHLLADGDEGLDTLIEGARVPGNPTERDGDGIKDLKLMFHTYGYSGN